MNSTAVMACPPTQATAWDSELFVLQAADRAGLRQRVQELMSFLEACPDVVLKDLAFTLNTNLTPGGSRLALVAGTTAELRSRLTRAGERLAEERVKQIKDVSGIYWFEEPLALQGKLALLFPGEGAQYLNMLSDLRPHFPEVCEVFEQCDRWATLQQRQPLSRFLFVAPDASPEERTSAETELRQLGNAMFSVMLADWALYRLLEQLGVKADAMAGHSMGELAAVWAAGCLDEGERLLTRTITTLDNLERHERTGPESVRL